MAGGARTSAERPPPGRRRSGTQKTARAPSKIESTLTTPRRHRLTTCAQPAKVKRFARENGAFKSLTDAHAHSSHMIDACRTSFAAVKIRIAPSPCAEREEQHLCTARGPHGQEVRAAHRRRARCRGVWSSAASGTRLEKRTGEVWSMGGQKRRCAKESHCHDHEKLLNLGQPGAHRSCTETEHASIECPCTRAASRTGAGSRRAWRP